MKKLCLIATALFALNATPSFAQDNTNKDPRQAAIAKTEQMANDLKLSSDQKKEVLEINMRYAVQKQNSSLSEKQLADLDKNNESRFRTILTEEQYAKYRVAKLKEAKNQKSSERANTDVKN